MDDSVEVGLTDSTRRAGKPSTWGSGQRKSNLLRDKISGGKKNATLCR